MANFHLRILQDLLNDPATAAGGVFLALVDGDRLPPALLGVDPRGADALAVLPIGLGGETDVLFVPDLNKGGLWYLSNPSTVTGVRPPGPFHSVAEAERYTIDTGVQHTTDLEGTTTVRFHSLVPGLRVLPLHLLSKLRVQAAAVATGDAANPWRPVPFVQEAEKEDADLAVVFPEPLAKDAPTELRLTYKGDEVLRDAGDGNYVVQARESWYPNLGTFLSAAAYDLTYRVPKPNQVVSVGRKLDEHDEGDVSVSHWQSETPIRVAGFNYGKFKRLGKTDEATKFEIEIFTNPGTPSIVREINADAEGQGAIPRSSEGGVIDTDEMSPFDAAPLAGTVMGRASTERLAQSALVDAMNAARVCTTYFGPIAKPHVAITQQSQWFFGQSWPSLIFLPYTSFLTGTVRAQLGLQLFLKGFVDEVGYHEMAHQWWGHLVGEESYHDAWLSEGFAQFSAALALQHAAGWKRYDKHWEDARKLILERSPGSTIPNNDAGPISLGYRLHTERTPWAYDAVVYYKGAYVLHMLRMLMRDQTAANPDTAFIDMMHDFTSHFAGKNASTADFMHTIERHMTPALNGTGDGKMNWFFDQWVYGTEVPRYVADLKVERASGDQYHVSGKLTQEGVSANFRALIPLYVEFSDGKQARFGVLPMIGASSRDVNVTMKMPGKPKKILINAGHEILARD